MDQADDDSEGMPQAQSPLNAHGMEGEDDVRPMAVEGKRKKATKQRKTAAQMESLERAFDGEPPQVDLCCARTFLFLSRSASCFQWLPTSSFNRQKKYHPDVLQSACCHRSCSGSTLCRFITADSHADLDLLSIRMRCLRIKFDSILAAIFLAL